MVSAGMVGAMGWRAGARVLLALLAAAMTPGHRAWADAALPGAVVILPSMPIQSAVDRHPPGSTYILAAGVHRMQQVVPKDGDRFVGAAGARMNGALVLSPAVRAGGWFVADGARLHPQLVRHGVCQRGKALCDRPLALFVGARRLWPVARLAELVPGSWYLDEAAGRVYLAEDPQGAAIELSHTPHAFGGTARGVRIESLVVERYASGNQRGAVNDSGGGQGWVVRDSEMRANYGYGMVVGSGGQALGNRLIGNGQLGLGGGMGRDILVEGNEIAFNGWNGTDCDWECGGAKWGAVVGLVVRGNHVHGNGGVGLWTDENCREVLIEGNLVEDNTRAGISHEISGAAVIRRNRLRGNGSLAFVWGWHGQIQVQNSFDTLVQDNRIELHPERGGNGIVLIQQDRGAGFAVRNVRVMNNEVVMRRGRGVLAGWYADFAAGGFAGQGNLFDGNRYRMGGRGGAAAAWSANGEVDFGNWQAGGQDRAGRVEPVAE